MKSVVQMMKMMMKMTILLIFYQIGIFVSDSHVWCVLQVKWAVQDVEVCCVVR